MRRPLLAIMACLLAASQACAQASTRPTASLLRALLQDYRSYGLPMPPAGARLAYLEPRSRRLRGFETTPHGYLVLVNPVPGPGRAPTFAAGLRTDEVPEYLAVRPVTPERASLAGTQTAWCRGALECAGTRMNVDMLAAAQMEARGWTRLALAFLRRGMAAYPGDARRALAAQAWAYWRSTLAEADSDRSVSLRRMRRMLALVPRLDTSANRALLVDLEAALRPSHARPGSVEADVDALVDYRLQDPGPSAEPGVHVLLEREPAAYRRLCERGFDAVPVLLDHLSDRRVTRRIEPGGMFQDPYHVRVGQVALELLDGLAGGEGVWPRRPMEPDLGWLGDRTVADVWWRRAQAVGEEGWLLAHVFGPKDTHIGLPEGVVLAAIAAKYPRHIPALCAVALQRPVEGTLGALLSLLRVGDYPRSVKVGLLVPGARSADRQRRTECIWALLYVDRRQAEPILVERLDALVASTPPGTLVGEARSMASATEVLDTPSAWEALRRLVARSGAAQREGILEQLAYVDVKGDTLRRCVTLAAGYLDDPAPAVRLMALRRVAAWLGVRGVPFWTDDARDWASLRPAVVRRLRAYLAAGR